MKIKYLIILIYILIQMVKYCSACDMNITTDKIIYPIFKASVIDIDSKGTIVQFQGKIRILKKGSKQYASIKVNDFVENDDILELEKNSTISIRLENHPSVFIESPNETKWFVFHLVQNNKNP